MKETLKVSKYVSMRFSRQRLSTCSSLGGVLLRSSDEWGVVWIKLSLRKRQATRWEVRPAARLGQACENRHGGAGLNKHTKVWSPRVNPVRLCREPETRRTGEPVPQLCVFCVCSVRVLIEQHTTPSHLRPPPEGPAFTNVGINYTKYKQLSSVGLKIDFGVIPSERHPGGRYRDQASYGGGGGPDKENQRQRL